MEFLNFKPGLVGGHCIGVDPYYLKFKALKEGFRISKLTSSEDLLTILCLNLYLKKSKKGS